VRFVIPPFYPGAFVMLSDSSAEAVSNSEKITRLALNLLLEAES
jgi:hypothetical protein